MAERLIPQEYQKEHIPGWSNENEKLYQNFLDSKDPEVVNELFHELD